jgi:Family of unknown function (DUF5677)
MPNGDMEFPEPPKGETQEYQRLVAAHDRYIRGVARVVIPAANPAGSIGRWVPYALYHHLIQLSRALHDLVVLGYSDEALPSGRAMLSAAVYSIFLVTSDNPDGWALRYWLQLTNQEQRMLLREQRISRFDPERVAGKLARTSTDHDGAIAAARAEGIDLPDKLIPDGEKKPRDTWTGLTDKGLFKHLNLADWHETEYDYLSTAIHVQPVALLPIRDDLIAGKKPVLGPHFRAPLPALTASVNSIRFSTLAMLKHYRLQDRLSDVDALSADMSAAIDAYREDTGINATVRAVLGERIPKSD